MRHQTSERSRFFALQHFAMIFLAMFLFTGSLLAGFPKGIFDALSTQGAKTTDNVTNVVRKMNLDVDSNWKNCVDHYSTKGGLSEADALKRLEKKFPEMPSEMIESIKASSDVERAAFVYLFDDIEKLIKVGEKQGLKAEEVYRAIGRGGPDSFYEVMARSSDEVKADYIRGLDQYGEKFKTLAQQGDDQVISSFMNVADRVPKKNIDDILQNPMNYFDEFGKPKKALDEILTSTRSTKSLIREMKIVGVITGIFAFFCPDKLIEMFPWLQHVRISISLIFLLVLVYFTFPILYPAFKWTCKIFLSIIKHFPGKVGVWGSDRIEKMRGKNKAPLEISGVVQKKTLRLGLLGTRRAGKSTFITILNKKLSECVKGSNFQIEDPQSRKTLKEIEEIVKYGKPTTEETREIVSRLQWPYSRKSEKEESQQNFQYNEEEKEIPTKEWTLLLKDYPGEYVCADPEDKDYKKILQYLKGIDGLIVVIDPTSIELNDGEMRIDNQKETLDNMFGGEGLKLGEEFNRALVLLVSKRDTLDEKWFSDHQPQKWAEKIDEGITEEEYKTLKAIAFEKEITEEQSQTLGRGVLRILYPGIYEALKGALSPDRSSKSDNWIKKVWNLLWPAYPQKPRIKAFAISQLGFTEGKRVSAYRSQHNNPEKEDYALDKPIDFKAIPASEVEIKYPFGWMFDNIPGGWLNEVNSKKGPFWKKYFTFLRRWRVWNYFPGNADVQKERFFFYRSVIVFIIALILVNLSFSRIYENYQVEKQEREETEKLEDAKDLLTNTLQNVNVPTVELKLAIEICRERKNNSFNTILNSLDDALTHTREKLDGFDSEIEQINSQVNEDLTCEEKKNLLQKQINNYLNWFVSYNDYSTSERLHEDQNLQEYVWYFDEFAENEEKRLKDRIADFRQFVREYSDLSKKIKDYQTTYETIYDVWSEITKQKFFNKENIANELNAVKVVFDDVAANYVKAEMEKGHVHQLVENKNYEDAIGQCDKLSEQFSKDGELISAINKERETILSSYWSDVSSEVEKAEKDGDFDTAEKKLNEFKKIKNLGENEKICNDQLNKIPGLKIDYIFVLVEGLSGNDQEALKTLLSVQNLMSSEFVTEEQKTKWYDKAIEVQLKLNHYEDAVNLAGGYSEETKRTTKKLDCWDIWIKYADRQIPTFIGDKNFNGAKEILNSLMQGISRCPEDLRPNIEGLNARYGNTINIGQICVKTEESDDQMNEETLNKLLGFWDRQEVQSVEDQGILGLWLDSVSKVYSHLERPEAAIQFFEDIKDKAYFSGVDQKINALIVHHNTEIFEKQWNRANRFEKDGNDAQAIVLLKTAQISVVYLSVDRQEEWFQTIANEYKKINGYVDLMILAEEIRNNSRFKITINDQMMEQFRSGYIEYIETEFVQREPQAAWSFLQSQWIQEKIDNVTRVKLEALIKEKIAAFLKDNDAKVSALNQSHEYEKASSLVRETESYLGIMKQFPGNNIGEWVSSTQANIREQQIDYRIDSVKTDSFSSEIECQNNYLEIEKLFKEEVSDANRDKLNEKKNQLLTNWENFCYQEICKSADNQEIQKTITLSNEYLSTGVAYRENRLHESDVQNLKTRAEKIKRFNELLEQARQESDPKQKIIILKNAKPFVIECDKEQQQEWIQQIIDEYQKQRLYLELTQYLIEVRDDRNFLIEVSDDQISQVREGYIDKVKESSQKEPTRLWQNLLNEWRNEVLDKDTRSQLKMLIQETIDRKINEIKRSADDSLDFEVVFIKFEKLKGQLQILKDVPDISFEDNLNGTIDVVLKKYINNAIGVNAEDVSVYKGNYDILCKIEQNTLTDNQKKEVEEGKKQILTRWENFCYNKISQSIKKMSFTNIDSYIEDYTSQKDLFNKVSVERCNEVQDVKDWFEGLKDDGLPFKIEKIICYNVPPRDFLSNDDLCFRITIEGNNESLNVSQDDLSGKVEIEAEDNEFTWYPGRKISIDIWEDKFDSDDDQKKIGYITNNNRYGLFDLMDKECKVEVSDKYKKRRYSGFTLSLEISIKKEFPSMKELPKNSVENK